MPLLILPFIPTSANFRANPHLNAGCHPDRDLSASSALWPSICPFEHSGRQVPGVRALDADGSRSGGQGLGTREGRGRWLATKTHSRPLHNPNLLFRQPIQPVHQGIYLRLQSRGVG